MGLVSNIDRGNPRWKVGTKARSAFQASLWRRKMINLGDKVKDIITGIKGIAIAKCIYLNGCNHIGFQLPFKDGKIPDIVWIDEPQVEVVTKSTRKKRKTRTGGPKQHPNRRR